MDDDEGPPATTRAPKAALTAALIQGGFLGAAPEAPKAAITEAPKAKAALAAATKAAKAAATKAAIVAKAGKAEVEAILIRNAEVQVKMLVPASEEQLDAASDVETAAQIRKVETAAAAAALVETVTLIRKVETDTLARAAVVTAEPTSDFLIRAEPTSDFLIRAEPTSSSVVEPACRPVHDPSAHNGAWWLVLTRLPTDEVLTTLPCVSRALSSLAAEAALLSAVLGSLPASGAPTSPIAWSRIEKAYPRGAFLAEGGFKRVYAVHNAVHRRTEAMSVLDLRHLHSQGLEETLSVELWVSYLLSQLAQRGRCPGFLRLHSAFRCMQAPPEAAWGRVPAGGADKADEAEVDEADEEGEGHSDDELALELEAISLGSVEVTTSETRAAAEGEAAATAATAATAAGAGRKPRKPPHRAVASTAAYQYVLAEFADGGDLEEACKRQPNAMFGTERLPALLFQMGFALYAAQQELCLRHYDVKLLNYFLATPPATAPAPKLGTPPAPPTGLIRGGEGHGEGGDADTLSLHIGCDGTHYRFSLGASEPSLCKLADFGTADISPASLGQPISSRHLTTLENTPPDFLLLGTRAVQTSAADGFGLGLCWLHLLTGLAPYEELMESVKCPAELRLSLTTVWCEPGKGSVYAPLRALIEEDEDEDESVLFHTLYRFLCLFGRPDLDPAHAADAVCESKAWRAVRSWLDTDAGAARFHKDHSAWSVFEGKQKVIAEARKRMAALPGAALVLKGLTTFEPTRRLSMRQLLRSELFTPYVTPSVVPSAAGARTMSFLGYLDDARDGAVEAVVRNGAEAVGARDGAEEAGARDGAEEAGAAVQLPPSVVPSAASQPPPSVVPSAASQPPPKPKPAAAQRGKRGGR